MNKSLLIHDRDIPGDWAGNLFLPTVLKQEWKNADDVLTSPPGVLTRMFPHQLWAVTSIVSSSYSASSRGDLTSHAKELSLDVSPAYSRSRLLKPNGMSSNMCDNLRLMTHLALYSWPVAVFVEDDHFHLDKRFIPGVYCFPSRHEQYKFVLPKHADPRRGKYYSVGVDGQVILIPDLTRCLK